ncbi:MAG: CRISPR-associated ring nuclease, partial [Candidatus Binatia bacterium]
MAATESNLVFLVGATPQIITETVYCLLDRGLSGAIHVLTTQTGKRAIDEKLHGQHGLWRRFQREHPGARKISLSRRSVVVLRDGLGCPLDDVRSRA